MASFNNFVLNYHSLNILVSHNAVAAKKFVILLTPTGRRRERYGRVGCVEKVFGCYTSYREVLLEVNNELLIHELQNQNETDYFL
mmetsp:Transcript_23174/g.34794  ORF Transcript_23174/g.34794 Transcript_23174/m.34794 type:complete len:85 (-) Transcript_23174:583-837(-)